MTLGHRYMGGGLPQVSTIILLMLLLSIIVVTVMHDSDRTHDSYKTLETLYLVRMAIGMDV